MKFRTLIFLTLCFTVISLGSSSMSLATDKPTREFNGPYTGRHLDRVSFPIGGIGAGMYCLDGNGAISHMSVRNQMEFTNMPKMYAALCVLGENGEDNIARVVEGPIPDWKYFGMPGAGNGLSHTTHGLPRFREAEFLDRFPFATIDLEDKLVPFTVRITGWSPFTPGDPDSSSLPVGALEYTFKNTSNTNKKAVFSYNAENFLVSPGSGSIGPIDGGFVFYQKAGKDRDRKGAFAIVVDGDKPIVDHCWFRGGWWDAMTVTWDNVQNGKMVDNPPVPSNARGASLSVPFELKPGEEKTIRLLTCWYTPETNLKQGRRTAPGGPAFDGTPSLGTGEEQQPVSGFLGKGLINTFDPGGDAPTGTLTSPEITLNKKNLHFLVGGGGKVGRTCVNLLVDGKVVATACGKDTEHLEWATFDLDKLQGKKARIQILDQSSDSWGHILADHFILSDEPIEKLKTGDGNKIVADSNRAVVLNSFDGKDYGGWQADPPVEKTCCASDGTCSTDATKKPIPKTHSPWYAGKLDSIFQVAEYWVQNYDDLKKRSETFRDTFYDTTLPPEVVEAVAANLTILKSPTIMRQQDGRLWCWEGCCDSHGCCAGSCTHVWNYAQAVCHLFPSLERTLRQTEYNESQDESGRQAFRANLPISPGGISFDASDGQLGGIMKAYREWRISGDRDWLAEYWPKIKTSLDYMIRKWDPRHTGLLEEDHHNTYDINYFGPDGHCGSFYLGALAAAARMGEELGKDVSLYKELLAKGKKRMVEELYNGEYFIQIVQKTGLDYNFKPIYPADQSKAYRETARIVNQQGPKYQYGTGCLSDGVLGLWMAAVCGIDEKLIDDAKVRSHLKAIHKYNLKHDLSTHANPQRPSFAMGDDGGLLLCTWPRGNRPLLPFVYSNEVWTGIEYQVASHLMLLGCVEEGLDIVRAARKRYDGVRRNPFNEYECGHWYARALSSYGLLQGLTGMRYDAVDKTLYVDSKGGDFRAFLATATGYGTVEFKDGKVKLEVKSGKIPVEKTVVKKG
ncbi:MAG: hypothetical protein JXM70_26985 [Pirellulales bacterium]|nr:hypothetical protein [Pirellulales bacterium]